MVIANVQFGIQPRRGVRDRAMYVIPLGLFSVYTPLHPEQFSDLRLYPLGCHLFIKGIKNSLSEGKGCFIGISYRLGF